MPNYDVILMDADDTLLDYPADASAALASALEQFGMCWSLEIEELYQKYNQAAWRRLERGEITKAELQILRFEQFFSEISSTADPTGFNEAYMSALAGGGRLLPGAKELCAALCRQVDLYIITNGVQQAQEGRMARCGLLPYFKKLYISDVIGYQKPKKEFFDYVLADIRQERGSLEVGRVIVFGDSLTSDMQGGINAGLTTCWYNPERKDSGNVSINYTVDNYSAFLAIIEMYNTSEIVT